MFNVKFHGMDMRVEIFTPDWTIVNFASTQSNFLLSSSSQAQINEVLLALLSSFETL